MKWYFPSWNGDLRIEAAGNDKTKLTIIEPTAHELDILGQIERLFRKKSWWRKDPLWDPEVHGKRRTVTLDARLADVAPFLVAATKPGAATLTAVVMKDGKVETTERATAELVSVAKKAETEGKAAASVKRPTPCCPQCFRDAVEPATEVLLEFLDEEQHAQWAADRTIVVEGGMSGHRYLVCHRRSDDAARIGRMCFDLDDQKVMHFHDNTVPPEEEVLAVKLILEHREPWLRNEATAFGGHTDVYKNPFGDGGDGIPDTMWTTEFGEAFMRSARLLEEAIRP